MHSQYLQDAHKWISLISTTLLYRSFYFLILWVKLRCWRCIGCLLQATNKRAKILFIPAILTSILVGLITSGQLWILAWTHPKTHSGCIWSLRTQKPDVVWKTAYSTGVLWKDQDTLVMSSESPSEGPPTLPTLFHKEPKIFHNFSGICGQTIKLKTTHTCLFTYKVRSSSVANGDAFDRAF